MQRGLGAVFHHTERNSDGWVSRRRGPRRRRHEYVAVTGPGQLEAIMFTQVRESKALVFLMCIKKQNRVF